MINKRKQVSMAVLACLVFIVDGLMIAGCWMEAQSAEQKLEHAHKVIDHIEAIDPVAQSLGGHTRRYISTGNEASLQALAESEAKIQKLLNELSTLVADDLQQQ